MFDDMAWTDDHGNGAAPSDWELELLRMRYNEGTRPSTNDEPMELSPDPFYFVTNSSASVNPSSGAAGQSLFLPTTNTNISNTNANQTQQPTLTTSASCPSFTSFYDIDSDDLLRDIPDGEPLTGESVLGTSAFANALAMGPPVGMDGFDYVLQFQQQMQTSLPLDPHLALLQQSRRPLHMSASFTSLSSMETEHRRRLASKRKKAVTERWNKAQRHKSFDSTTSSVTTAPSPVASMEFSTFDSNSTFESTPETQLLEDAAAPPRGVAESDMIGFSIDDFPTTFTSDASWPMPPPLSLADASSFDGFSHTGSHAATPFQPGPVDTSGTTTSTEMDQLLLSDQERANVSSLFDAIRDFDSPAQPTSMFTPTNASKKSSPTLTGKPRPGQSRSSRNLHLRGIARSDAIRRKEPMQPVVEPPSEEPSLLLIHERIQKILERTSSAVQLSADEQEYLSQAPQFAQEKAAETAGSLWLLLHGSRCIESNCSVTGCDVMRRVVRHCRGCDAPLGKCKDPCNDAKAMLLHHGTCKFVTTQKTKATEPSDSPECALCAKVQEIDRNHNSISSRPPLSPQLKPQVSPPLLTMPMPMVPMTMPLASPLGGPVLIAPQPPFASPSLKPASAGGGGKHINIQPNPLPTASNPMGLIGSFPHFGCSLALYLEQTAPAFRAEVKARVEKRVTAAAGQDLIQHMQKKTRLRSLDDLRSEARATVLREMEQELHLHMQAVNWANAANASGTEGDAAPPPPPSQAELPSYLLNVAAAGFAAFYAQQATLQAAMAGMASRPLSRQSSTTSIAPPPPPAVPLAPRKPPTESPALGPKDPLTTADPSKKGALAV